MSPETYIEQIRLAADFIRSKITTVPDTGIILGSGLGDFANIVVEATVINFNDIPNFPPSTVEGHKGRMIIGKIGERNVLIMQGRIHYYEGYTMKQVTFPVRIMQFLGIKNLIVTNASGGLNPQLYVGALVVIKDHLNLMGDNPLMGVNATELGVRFPDMSGAYTTTFRDLLTQIALEEGVPLHPGVYAGVSGPCYETPAEAKQLHQSGADIVGMSTVPEVIAGVHAGMKILGISIVTDMPGSGVHTITHEEVIEVAAKAGPVFIHLLEKFVRRM
ncbi:MAG: purine-nucleoside phosphorylase [Saprospiraceae bacterium]|nr:purine-nucleoside phosphorylase [Saprospiraceae bacterium]